MQVRFCYHITYEQNFWFSKFCVLELQVRHQGLELKQK